MPITLQDVIDSSIKRDKELQCQDFDCDLVVVVHGDGSVFSIVSARVEEIDDWLIVYSEHNCPLVFNRGDLDENRGITTYSRKRGE